MNDPQQAPPADRRAAVNIPAIEATIVKALEAIWPLETINLPSVKSQISELAQVVYDEAIAMEQLNEAVASVARDLHAHGCKHLVKLSSQGLTSADLLGANLKADTLKILRQPRSVHL